MISSAKMVCYKSITTELKGTRLSEEDICLINQNLSCICNIAGVGMLEYNVIWGYPPFDDCWNTAAPIFYNRKNSQLL